MTRLTALLIALAATLVLTFLAVRPPGPAPASAPAAAFSAARAMPDVREIARAPHPTATAENARVRAYLTARLRQLGLTVEAEPAPLTPKGAERLRRWQSPPGPAVNLIAVLPGRDRTAPAVGIMAHYDTVLGSPGAPDDTAGVAAILEIVRALKRGPALMRDVVVVLTDAEELNSDGAAVFFASHAQAKRLGAVVNLESRGGGGRALMFEAGPHDGAMVGLYARAVRRPSANSLAVLIYQAMPNFSDFSIPKAQGTPGFNLAFLGAPGLYHSPLATPDRLDQGSLQHLGGQALDIVRALATAPTLPGKAPDAVFADVLGAGLIVYPPWVGWLVLAVSAVLLGFAYRRARAGEGFRDAELAIGAAWGFGLLLLVGVALNAANVISGEGRGANYYDRLAAIPRLEVQALCMSAAVLLAMMFARPPLEAWGRWIGLGLLVLGATALVQGGAPAAAPVLAWPLLLASAGAAFAAGRDLSLRSPVVLAVLAAVAALGLAQALAQAHLAFLGVGSDAPAALAGFVLVAALLLWPLLDSAAPRRLMLVFAAVLAVAALGLALSVRFDPLSPTVPAYSVRGG